MAVRSASFSAAGVLPKRGGQAVTTSALPLDPDAPSVARFHIDEPLVSDSTYYVSVNGGGPTPTHRPLQRATKTTDTIVPTISLVQPSAAWVTTAKPTLAVSYSDATSGIDVSTAQMRLDGQVVAISVSTNSMTHTPTTPLAEGKHAVNAEVRDRAVARNRAELARELGVDTENPSPTTTSILSGLTLRGSVPISAEASDATSGIAKIDILSMASTVARRSSAVCGDNPSATCTVTGSFATQGRAEGPHTRDVARRGPRRQRTVGEAIHISIETTRASSRAVLGLVADR
jgi:hypothetical protein